MQTAMRWTKSESVCGFYFAVYKSPAVIERVFDSSSLSLSGINEKRD